MYDHEDEKPPWEQPNGSGDWISLAVMFLILLGAVGLVYFLLYW